MYIYILCIHVDRKLYVYKIRRIKNETEQLIQRKFCLTLFIPVFPFHLRFSFSNKKKNAWSYK